LILRWVARLSLALTQSAGAAQKSTRLPRINHIRVQ
jgi:hypothetical protein